MKINDETSDERVKVVCEYLLMEPNRDGDDESAPASVCMDTKIMLTFIHFITYHHHHAPPTHTHTYTHSHTA